MHIFSIADQVPVYLVIPAARLDRREMLRPYCQPLWNKIKLWTRDITPSFKALPAQHLTHRRSFWSAYSLSHSLSSFVPRLAMCSPFIRYCLLLLSFGAAAVSAFSPLNPTPSQMRTHKVSHKHEAVPQLALRGMTNAKRFAAGLPPLPPHRKPLGQRTKTARSASASTVPGTPSNIEILDSASKASLGFLSSRYNSFGEASLATDTDPNNRMVIITPPNGGPVDVQTVNGPNALYPFLGGIKDVTSPNNMIGPTSSDFGYLGGTLQTFPGSSPVLAGNTFTAATGLPVPIESAIWYHDTVTGALTAQWVNPDGTLPTTYLGYIQGFLIFTGNQTAFAATYGQPTWVDFTIASLA
ncbi:hypothetical protein CPB84DRAFT_1245091 [Gymnopilus junonius]|uniref:Uncharacterized protein n=1 Tax=Gymnopilus junonius TaxID=109634 RepID=A0A9P5NKP9_GYMJU|nr:hypothetical protein CPB84DRAFT_1245091 [Gymnopilus junonius]